MLTSGSPALTFRGERPRDGQSQEPARASTPPMLTRSGGRVAAGCAAGAFLLSLLALAPGLGSVPYVLAVPALLAVAAWVVGGFTMSTDAPKDPALAAAFAREKRFAFWGIAAAFVWTALAFFVLPAL